MYVYAHSCDSHVTCILIVYSYYAISWTLQLLSHCHSHSHTPSSGAETVRFIAEINVDGRKITRMYLSKMDLEALLKVSYRQLWYSVCVCACVHLWVGRWVRVYMCVCV